ncbi:hypothetical protein HDU91_001746 [Kappamyces sp. JEL0680]|nr:hypothetical protein HDU91_001746 [Kappamyces sp. JEL0680]
MPQFQILGIVPADSNAYSLTGFDQADPSKLTFSMNMILTIAVMNTNPYHFKVENINLAVMIDANGTMINNASPITASNFFGGAPLQSPRPWVTKDNFRNQIATGTVGVTTFPAGQNITFKMPLTVNYSPNKSMGVYDPTLNEIIQVCTYDYNQQNTPNSGPLTRVINIHYKAENNIGLLKYIGMTPTIEGASRINCPFQGKDLNDFMEKLKSGGL